MANEVLILMETCFFGYNIWQNNANAGGNLQTGTAETVFFYGIIALILLL